MTFRSAALGIALAAALCSTAVVAVAQIAPADAGLGVKLGMEQQNNSGEVGTVTLFARGANTLVDLRIFGEPAGRSQPAHIHRGKSCEKLDPKPAFPLAPVVNGRSKTLVHQPIAKLTSGNYVVNVHASQQNIAHYVSCGHLIPQS